VDGRTDVRTDGHFSPSNIIRSTFGSRPKNDVNYYKSDDIQTGFENSKQIYTYPCMSRSHEKQCQLFASQISEVPESCVPEMQSNE